MKNHCDAETATEAPANPVHDHVEEKTIVEIAAQVPGYKIGFFVAHETVKDSTKTISPRLDTDTQKALN